jgi:RimJ/RimL family protein N-acetyltransferase
MVTGPDSLVCVEVPVIETARLVLRRHRLDDFAEAAEMWADPAVVRHIGGRPSSAEQTWARLMGYLGHWALMRFGYWAIEEQASGRFVGEVGFADFKRSLEPPLDAPEVGWALAAHAHGKGYATEAVRAVGVWGDERFGGSRTVCIIDPDNGGSIRVAEKCGFREWRRTAYRDAPTILFERSGPA